MNKRQTAKAAILAAFVLFDLWILVSFLQIDFSAARSAWNFFEVIT